MQLVTNPGSNLSAEVIARYGIHVTPQQIVVDGFAHDTRIPIALGEVDRWTATAREWPHVVGTTAPEFATLFAEIAKTDPEIVAVMTSKKIIQSYAAANVAARATKERASFRDARIAVVDSGMTDVGAGLVTLLAAEAIAAKKSMDETVALLERHAAASRLMLHVPELAYLVKGGRASHLRAWLAKVFDRRPVLGFIDGEIKVAVSLRVRDDAAKAVVEHVAKEIGTSKPVWIGIAHGQAEGAARAMLAEAKRVFHVVYVLQRALSPSIYLHGGPGAVAFAVLPLDAEGQRLGTPTVK